MPALGTRGAIAPSEVRGEAEVEREIFDFFIGKGLTPAQAAGIVGNAKQESSLNPQAAGGGLFQYIGSRGASGYGTVKEQLSHTWRELVGPERNALEALRKAHTPQEAARVFSNLFERPGTPMLGNREKYAIESLQKQSGKGGNPISELNKKLGLPNIFEVLEGETPNPLKTVEAAGEAVGATAKLAGMIAHWIEEPLIPVKFLGGAFLLYVGIRTLTGGTTATREAGRAHSYATEPLRAAKKVAAVAAK